MISGSTTLPRRRGHSTVQGAPTSRAFMARKAQRQQVTYLGDVGERAPDAILSPDSYGCLVDLAATRRVPAVQTCCSMTSGLSTGPIGPGSVALTREMPPALTVLKAPPRWVINLQRVKHRLAGSITAATSGCSAALRAARTDSTIYGSMTMWPNNGRG